MKYTLILLLSLLTSHAFASNTNKVDLTGIGIKTSSSQGACEDKNGHDYSEGTILSFLEKGKYYSVICDRKILNAHVWEVISVHNSSYSSETWDDGLGCRDANGRIFEEGAKINESFSSGRYSKTASIRENYLCKQKNGIHYLVVD